MNAIIKENDTYKLMVGEAVLPESSGKNITCYQIISKEHGVVEAETTILFQALEWIDEFDTMLKRTLSNTSDNVSENLEPTLQ